MKHIIFLLILMSIQTCRGQNDKNMTTDKRNDLNEKIIIPNLFDKRYFHGYQLSPDSDYPIYTFANKDIGSVTVNFINKNIKKQEEWFQFDFKNGLDSGDDPDDKYFNDLNKMIKPKLESHLDNYYIIAEFVPYKYIKISRDYIDHIYPYKKTYYLYNKEKKSWDFLKEKTVSDGNDEKNITKLAELNTMMGIKPANSIVNIAEIHTVNTSISLEKLDGIWSDDCNSNKTIAFISTLESVQFSIPNRFSMNAQLKKIDVNKYEFYFTDFPPIIPLPDEMEVWDNMDNKKPVGTIEIINESKVNLTWFGFYYKKSKKYIQTENPFNKNSNVATIIHCTDK
ncbi:hypothetical protein SAMN05421841_4121 [Chryseobacterium wanjuense]|uniref:Uncharacterized protein n=1 Tax=Chryseobacterium wanjuense TaxID=356305 RepID=A0A1I0S3D6_9FLAO|nr:hypothetical protein [Chryseobacterium wanjuense]SEW49321.1 hypothetical protein SAMN05421841_4121 [Chryseobacterium wanjuense]